MANVNNLLVLAGTLTLYPERHHQGWWVNTEGLTEKTPVKKVGAGKKNACGTRACAAGWTAINHAPEDAIFSPGDGGAFYVPNPFGDWMVHGEHGEIVDSLADVDFGEQGIVVDRISIPTFAEETLGLTHEQANHLFYETSSTEEVLAIIKLFIQKPRATYADMERVSNKFYK